MISEAILLKNLQATGVTQALVCFFSKVGILKEILTDQGAIFTSAVLK